MTLLRRLRVSALACGFWRAMGAAGDMTMATGNYAPFEIGRIAKVRCPDKAVAQYVILRILRSHRRRVAFDRRRNGLLFLELLRSPC